MDVVGREDRWEAGEPGYRLARNFPKNPEFVLKVVSSTIVPKLIALHEGNDELLDSTSKSHNLEVKA